MLDVFNGLFAVRLPRKNLFPLFCTIIFFLYPFTSDITFIPILTGIGVLAVYKGITRYKNINGYIYVYILIYPN